MQKERGLFGLSSFALIVLTVNPVLIPLIGVGVYRIFKRFGDTRYSIFGIMFLVTLVLLFVLHARAMMLAELCIPIMAAGAVWLEEMLTGPGWKKGVRIAAVSCMIAGGILVAPVTLPLLPLPLMSSYTQAFGFLFKPVKDFNDPKSDFPQEFSNRIGWDDLVKTVADVYHSLPLEDQAKAGIFCDWYGPAGAIDLMGPKQRKVRISNDFAMPYNRSTIYVARNPHWSSKVIWAELKGY